MTRDEYWNMLVKKNPSILTHKVVMKPENFKAFFEQVWQKASEQRGSQQKFYENFPWIGGN